MKRYGLIGNCYNTGISHIASGFAEHLNMKALLVDNKPFTAFPQRFKNHRITKTLSPEDVEWLLSDIDVLMIIETPYDWNILIRAWTKGVKIVFMPMIEWLDRSKKELRYVSLFLCPSPYTTKKLREDRILTPCFELPCEVPSDGTKFKKRKKITKIKTFLHNAGHGGIGGRNSTTELMQAIKMTTIPARFIIRSQFPIPNKVQDARITYIEGNVENYWDLYNEGDVWIMPWKYGAAALGIQESLAAGMLPCITDMDPFNKYIPKELLIKPKSLSERPHYAGQEELYADQDPVLIAQTMEKLYSLPSAKIYKLFNWAEKKKKYFDWEIWKPVLIDAFDQL